ncbi:MAG: glycosyltransferase family 2 protein [Sphingomonadaceae bacterium]
MSTPLLSVVVPVKDEEGAIASFVARVGAVLDGLDDPAAKAWEILFVDDGSSDATLAQIHAAHCADNRIVALSLSRNFGKEAALSAGLDHARGTAVIPIDVDLQDPPEVIADMVRAWRGGSDVVYGVRRDRTSDSFIKRVTAGWYYQAHNALSHEKIPEHAGDFRLLDRKVIDVIKAMPERNRFMKGLYAWSGFTQTGVEYDRTERLIGTTKFRYWKLWTLALDGITSSSTAPLRIWSYIGVVVALLSFLYALLIIGRTIWWGIETPGYASLITTVLFLGGLQLISLGVLGEYVGRILVEAKQRPLYVVRTQIGIES